MFELRLVTIEFIGFLILLNCVIRSSGLMRLSVQAGIFVGGFYWTAEILTRSQTKSPIVVFLSVIVFPIMKSLTPLLTPAKWWLAGGIGAGLLLLFGQVLWYRLCSPRFELWKQKRLRKRMGSFEAPEFKKLDYELSSYIKEGAEADTYFIGLDQKSNPVKIKQADLSMHVQVVGPSGQGKTSSVIFPLVIQSVLKNHSCVLVDGKGDAGLIQAVKGYWKGHDKLKEFLFFTPLTPENSHTYNPLASTHDPAELTDLLSIGLNLNVEGPGRVYSDTQKAFLLQLFNLFLSTEKKFNFEDILMFVNHDDVRDYVYSLSKNRMVDDMRSLLKKLKINLPELLGFVTLIDKLFISDPKMFPLVNSYSSDIDIRAILQNRRFCLFSFSAGKKAETNGALAKIVLADIANAVGERHSKSGNEFAAIVLDEFGQYASQKFDKFVSTARSANIGIVFSHQTNAQLRDLSGNDRLAVIVRENSATKIIFRQSEEADFWARVFGTKGAFKRTDQLEEGRFFTDKYTSTGSLREVEEFVIHPNVLKNLKIGQVAYRSKDGPGQLLSTGLFHRIQDGATETVCPERPEFKTIGLNLREFHLDHLAQIKKKKVEKSIPLESSPQKVRLRI